ncbi:MAG: cobyrinate a,c-diamide synthase [Johnsonella sp.]|nr:cobyrinate a,c-diamide synthase [Johnsonella sp.]
MKKSLMIAAMNSHQGKTVLSMALIAAWRRRGLRVCSFKTGPDYIDPILHRLLSGRECINLEPYFLEEENIPGGIQNQFMRYAKDADIALIEAAMGYYSGIYGQEPRASAFSVAAALNTAVILLADAKEGVEIEALKEYIGRYKPCFIKGLVLNRISRERYEKDKADLERSLGLRLFGFLEEDEVFLLQSRHLGLSLPESSEDLSSKAKELARRAEKSLDLDGLLALVREEKGSACREEERENFPKKSSRNEAAKERLKIGVARDEALFFLYEDNLRLLEESGMEIRYFSILRDGALPRDICGIWLPGGYPESYGKEIEQNARLREEIREKIAEGMPCIAECGGFLYLHREIEGEDKKTYLGCGVIGSRAYAAGKLLRFGYIELRAKRDNLLLERGESCRSHEFHYWESENPGSDCRADKANASKSWEAVHATNTLFAGFPHIYLRANPKMAERFYTSCAGYQAKKERG